VKVRFGLPVMRLPEVDVRDQVCAIEEEVRRLSGLEHAPDAEERAMSDVATAGVLK
jgi:hypothetical protein